MQTKVYHSMDYDALVLNMTKRIESLERMMGGTEQYFGTVTEHSKILITFLFLFSNKMLIITVGIHKIFVRIANKEDLDQVASSEGKTRPVWLGSVLFV